MKNRTRLPNIFLGIILVIMYLPILLTIIYSFNESRNYSVWGGWSLNWYQELFQDRDIKEALINSLVLAALSCTASAIIGTLGAVGMSKLRNKPRRIKNQKKQPHKNPLEQSERQQEREKNSGFASLTMNVIEYFSTLPIMIPEIILGMVFLAFFSLLGLPFGMTTLVLAHTTFCIPYIFMMVKARLVGMDKSLEEAARDLGASQIRTFFDIVLPLISPAIISGMILSFAMSFDDVIISIFVTGATVNTLPIKIYTRMKTGVTPEINALSAIMFSATLFLIFLSGVFKKRGAREKLNNNQTRKV